jgi:hypothetical protein
MAGVVGLRQHVSLSLNEQLCSVAANDREKRIRIRLLESVLKSELIAVERDRAVNVGNDEARGHCSKGCSGHAK